MKLKQRGLFVAATLVTLASMPCMVKASAYGHLSKKEFDEKLREIELKIIEDGALGVLRKNGAFGMGLVEAKKKERKTNNANTRKEEYRKAKKENKKRRRQYRRFSSRGAFEGSVKKKLVKFDGKITERT